MTKFHITALTAVLLACSMAVSAQAQSTSAPAQPATQAAPAKVNHGHDPNTVICKRATEEGSRLGGHQDCHTRAQWEQMSRDAAEATAQQQSLSGFGGAPASMGH